ncbi:MAG: hypothetical protein ACRDRA_07030 [Pseudonocardiaceae bacterium]
MTLIVMTVVVIALLLVALAIYLFVIGVLLNRTADNLGDCLQSLRTVAGQANVICPGVQRLNKTGGELLDALPLLLEDVEGVTAKLAPSANTPETAPAAAVAPPAAASSASATPSTATQTSVGHLDPDPAPAKGVGYMDS